MNLSEFKSWFEGFTENLDGVPNPKQWARIRAKIGEIKDAPATTRVEYIYSYPQYWQPYQPVRWGTYYSTNIGGSVQAHQNYQQAQAQTLGQGLLAGQSGQHVIDWNSGEAFKQMGRAEAAEVN